MALLDVSQVLWDVDLASTFTVRRRRQTVDAHGRSVSNESFFYNVVGVVNAGDPNSLERGNPGYEFATNTISVVTAFDLYGEMEGLLPDIIVFNNTNFVVREINQYPQFGRGFTQAICTSMDRQDQVTLPNLGGNMALNTTTNSYLAGLL